MATSVNLTGVHITESTQAAATERLNKIYTLKKRAEGLTQVKLAKLMGLRHQSAVSHYLLGQKDLNTAVVLKFAQALNVSPADIYPELMEPVRKLFSPSVKVPVRYALHGDPTTLSIETVAVQENLNPYAVEINSDDYLPHYLNGSFVICSSRLQPKPGMEVFVEHADEKHLYRFLSEADGMSQFMHLGSSSIHTILADTITTCDVIVGTHRAAADWEFRAEYSE